MLNKIWNRPVTKNKFRIKTFTYYIPAPHREKRVIERNNLIVLFVALSKGGTRLFRPKLKLITDRLSLVCGFSYF